MASATYTTALHLSRLLTDVQETTWLAANFTTVKVFQFLLTLLSLPDLFASLTELRVRGSKEQAGPERHS